MSHEGQLYLTKVKEKCYEEKHYIKFKKKKKQVLINLDRCSFRVNIIFN